MALYRQYEDPGVINKLLTEAKSKLAEDPSDIDQYLEVAELEERLRFAWADEEAEANGWE